MRVFVGLDNLEKNIICWISEGKSNQRSEVLKIRLQIYLKIGKFTYLLVADGPVKKNISV